MGRNVQRIKVMVVVLDLRPGSNGKAQLGEKGFNAFDGARNRVQATVFHPPTRQGDIDGLLREAGIQRRRLQRRLTGVQGLLNLLLGLVDDRPGRRTLFCRQIAQ